MRMECVCVKSCCVEQKCVCARGVEKGPALRLALEGALGQGGSGTGGAVGGG